MPQTFEIGPYPEQEKAIEVGRRRWDKIKNDVGPGKTFASEGERKDYERRVRSNRYNVLGIPTFLPAEYIQVGMGGAVRYTCTRCNAPIASAFIKCDTCGHADEMCTNGHPFYERFDDNGVRFCARCGIKKPEYNHDD